MPTDDGQDPSSTLPPRGITGDIAAFGTAAVKGAASSVGGLWSFVKTGVEGDYLLATDPEVRAAAWSKATSMASSTADYASAALDDPSKPILDARDWVLSAYNSFDQGRLNAAAQGQSAEFWGNIAGKTGVGAAVVVASGGIGGAAEGVAAEGAEGVAEVATTAIKEPAELVARFSSRGPTLIDHVVKPDLVAPGYRVVSDLALQSDAIPDFPVSEVVDCPAKAIAEFAAPTILTKEQAQALLVQNGMSAKRAVDYVNSFVGPITARAVQSGETFLRYTDAADGTGTFLTKQVFANPADAVRSLCLAPYGNQATLVQTVMASSPSVVLEGGVANGAAGVQQTVLMDRSAFQFGTGVKYYGGQ